MSAIRTQISQLQVQSLNRQRELEEVSGGQFKWDEVMFALFSVESPGTNFLSVSLRPDGIVNLEGVANDANAITTLPSQLSQISDVLEFQNFRTTPGSVPPAFSVEFKVRQ